jgi:hypothetical protein
MNRTFPSLLAPSMALLCFCVYAKEATWLDELNPRNWNKAGMSIPAAPPPQQENARACEGHSRPPQFLEDTNVSEQGWKLMGPYQGGWNVLVIAAAAGYDGMCRPLRYQYFVFVRGAFAGTLSPELMNSRTDGALNRVSFHPSGNTLDAQYLRYTPSDALCCPSRTANVVFEIDRLERVVRPKVATTAPNRP